MLPNPSKNNQHNLFHNQFRDMLDLSDPLVALADLINWEEFDESFEKYYSDNNYNAQLNNLLNIKFQNFNKTTFFKAEDICNSPG